MSTWDHIQKLVDLSKDSRLAVLYYRKGVTSKKLQPRLIEPYCFADGKQDLMIRAFQLQEGSDTGKAGWRFFMQHKIESVEPTTIQFTPRRKVTLPSGAVTETAAPRSEHWEQPGRREYRDLVGDALADGELDPGEMFDLIGIKQRFKLGLEDIRFVHASVYQRCLETVLDDGFLAEDELDQIRFLHRAMRSLGWAVGD